MGHLIDEVKRINYQGSYYMRTRRFEDKEDVAERLAQVVGVNNDEVLVFSQII